MKLQINNFEKLEEQIQEHIQDMIAEHTQDFIFIDEVN